MTLTLQLTDEDRPAICEHCRWWRAEFDASEGDCRRHAPIGIREMGRSIGAWPRTLHGEGCGDFQRQDASQA